MVLCVLLVLHGELEPMNTHTDGEPNLGCDFWIYTGAKRIHTGEPNLGCDFWIYAEQNESTLAVSYTHLTLPTILRV